jgi:hypothetical protein
MVVTAGRLCKFFTQFANEDIDDLQFRFVHAAINAMEFNTVSVGYDSSCADCVQLQMAAHLQRHNLNRR